MEALIRPRGCSKANKAHQNGPEGKDGPVTPSRLGENCSQELRRSQQKGEPEGRA